MSGSNRNSDTTIDNDECDVLGPKSPEDVADQFGIRAALLMLYAALVIAAIWFVSSPSFEKCSALQNVTDRNACYDGLRNELLKPPAKGTDVLRAKF